MNDQDTAHTVKQGTLGIVSTAAGGAISFADQLEPWLRIASLLIGIAVGIITLINLIRKLRR